MTNRIRRRGDSSPLMDSDFLAALEEEDTERRAHARHQEHKTRQFCAQVKRVLNVVLAGQLPETSLDGIFVDEVLPMQGCGHLIARIVIPKDSDANKVLAELRACAPRLRAELARSISRKRVPELSFVPTLPTEGVL